MIAERKEQVTFNQTGAYDTADGQLVNSDPFRCQSP